MSRTEVAESAWQAAQELVADTERLAANPQRPVCLPLSAGLTAGDLPQLRDHPTRGTR